MIFHALHDNAHMFQSHDSSLLVRVASFGVWALVAFSAVAWGLRWSASADNGIVYPMVQSASASPDVETAARGLGVQAAGVVAEPTLASRFQLVGVVAGGASQGAALIAVDGKPAKPFRVGATVAEGLMLQSVQGRRVSLGPSSDAAAALVLELPLKK
jgi:general secretion pathway protein C